MRNYQYKFILFILIFLLFQTKALADKLKITKVGEPYKTGNVYIQNLNVDFRTCRQWTLKCCMQNRFFRNTSRPRQKIHISKLEIYDINSSTTHKFKPNNPTILKTDSTAGSYTENYQLRLTIADGMRPGDYANIINFELISDFGGAMDFCPIAYPVEPNYSMTITNPNISIFISPENASVPGYEQINETDTDIEVRSNVKWKLRAKSLTSDNPLNLEYKVITSSSYVTKYTDIFKPFNDDKYKTIAKGKATVDENNNLVPAQIKIKTKIKLPQYILEAGDYIYPVSFILADSL